MMSWGRIHCDSHPQDRIMDNQPIYTRDRSMDSYLNGYHQGNHQLNQLNHSQTVPRRRNSFNPGFSNNPNNNILSRTPNNPEIQNNTSRRQGDPESTWSRLHRDPEDIIFNQSSGVTRVPAQRQRRHSIQLGGSGPGINTNPISKTDQQIIDSLIRNSKTPTVDLKSPGQFIRRQRSNPPEHQRQRQPESQNNKEPIGNNITNKQLLQRESNQFNLDKKSQQEILFHKHSGVTRIPAQRQRRHSVQFGGTGLSYHPVRVQTTDHPVRVQTTDHPVRAQTTNQKLIGSLLDNKQQSSTSKVLDWQTSTPSILRERLKILDQHTDPQDLDNHRLRNIKPRTRDTCFSQTNGQQKLDNSADDILFNKQSGVTRIPATRTRRHSIQFGGTGSFCNLNKSNLQRQEVSSLCNSKPSEHFTTGQNLSSARNSLEFDKKLAATKPRRGSADPNRSRYLKDSAPNFKNRHLNQSDKVNNTLLNKDPDDILFDKQSGVTRVSAQRQRRHSIQFGGAGIPSQPITNYLKLSDKQVSPLLTDSETESKYSKILDKRNLTKRPNYLNLDSKTTDPKVDTDHILFNKQSGVTRIPAQRQRRHSIQFGGTGSFTSQSPALTAGQSTVNSVQGLDTRNIVKRGELSSFRREPPNSANLERSKFRRNLDNFNSHKPEYYTQSIPDGYSSDTEILNSHLYNRRQGMGVLPKEKPRRLSADLSMSGDLGMSDKSGVRHGTSIYIRRPSISSLTLSKDSYFRDNEGRAFRKTGDGIDGCMSDTEGDNYIKRNIHVRRHSISTPPSHNLRTAPTPRLVNDFQNWQGYDTSKLNHPNPISKPNSLDLQNNSLFDQGTQSDTSCGRLIPIRRYSVTYAPSVDTSDSDSGVVCQPVNSKMYLAPPREEKSRRRTHRRRCRPLSIVKEDISPVSVGDDDPDKSILNGFIDSDNPMSSTNNHYISNIHDIITTPHQSARRASDTEVSIKQSDGKNVNIKATGDIHISLNTDKPVAMVGRSKDDKSSEFAMWTPGADMEQIARSFAQRPDMTQPSMMGNAFHGNPFGMYRQGNVLVDSVTPVMQGNANPYMMIPGQMQPHVMYPGGVPWGQPQHYPAPMMMIPPCNPNLYSNNQKYLPGPAPQKDQPIYAPLCVDTGTPQNGMARVVPQRNTTGPNGITTDRHGTVQNYGLLQTAAPQQNMVSENKHQINSVPRKYKEAGHQQATVNGLDTSRALAPSNYQEIPHQQAIVNGLGTSRALAPNNCQEIPHQNGQESDSEQTGQRRDIRELIADFENKTTLTSAEQSSVPEFGTVYGTESAIAENITGARNPQSTTTNIKTIGQKVRLSGEEIYSQTEPSVNESDPKYELEVEKHNGKWTNTEDKTQKEPTPLHAFIGEMSISEVRFGDNNEKQ